MFTDLIKKRRSVRTYSDKPIARETLQVIVDAVFHAPTAKDLNDVELFIVEEREARAEYLPEKLRGAYSQGTGGYCRAIRHGSVTRKQPTGCLHRRHLYPVTGGRPRSGSLLDQRQQRIRRERPTGHHKAPRDTGCTR